MILGIVIESIAVKSVVHTLTLTVKYKLFTVGKSSCKTYTIIIT